MRFNKTDWVVFIMFIPPYTVAAIVKGVECSRPSPDFTYSIIYSLHNLFSGPILCAFLTLVQLCYPPKYKDLMFCNFLADAVLIGCKMGSNQPFKFTVVVLYQRRSPQMAKSMSLSQIRSITQASHLMGNAQSISSSP